MTVTIKDGLYTFGTNQIVEVPPDLSVGGDIENTNDASQKAPLGILYRHKGAIYRYVKFDDGAAVAAAAGGVAHWDVLDPDDGKFTVTSDYSDGVGKNAIAGVFLNAVTDQYYTWIQVGGVVDAFVAALTAIGDVMIYNATDLYFDRCAADAAVTGMPFGVAMEEVGQDNKALVLLLNLIW